MIKFQYDSPDGDIYTLDEIVSVNVHGDDVYSMTDDEILNLIKCKIGEAFMVGNMIITRIE